MANTYPTLNEVAPSWADFSAKFSVQGGRLLETVDFSDLSWNGKVEIGEQRGPGSVVKARTTGQLKLGASATLYASGFDALVDALAEKAPQQAGEYLVSLVTFDIFAMWTPFGATSIRKVEVLGCRLLGIDGKAAEGTDATAETCELNPAKLIYTSPTGKRIRLL